MRELQRGLIKISNVSGLIPNYIYINLTCDEDTPNGQTRLRALAEEPRCLTGTRQTIQGTRRRIQIGVTGGEGGNQNDSVDDGRKRLDVGVLDGNDEWGGRSGGRTQESGVVVRH